MPASDALPTSTYHASDGAAYDRWLGRWAERLAEALIDFAEFPGAGDLLDVGCGTGALTFALAKRWPQRRVVGLDLAEPFITYARARAARLSPPTFALCDACGLPSQYREFAVAPRQLLVLFILT